METSKPVTSFSAKSPSKHPYHPDATNDPLVGTQEHPDQAAELKSEPEQEAAPWPTRGRAVKSRLLAGLLGVFLGGLGLHRFYLSYVEIGVCQLAMFLLSFGFVVVYGLVSGMPRGPMMLIAVFTAALVWLWGAVEGVMILAGMLPHDGHGHPLR